MVWHTETVRETYPLASQSVVASIADAFREASQWGPTQHFHIGTNDEREFVRLWREMLTYGTPEPAGFGCVKVTSGKNLVAVSFTPQGCFDLGVAMHRCLLAGLHLIPVVDEEDRVVARFVQDPHLPVSGIEPSPESYGDGKTVVYYRQDNENRQFTESFTEVVTFAGRRVESSLEIPEIVAKLQNL